MKQYNIRDNTLFLRFLAIVLVINSHMDLFYPVPMFSTGGAIGNSIFFMLSSFGLLLSEINKPQTLTKYFIKRLVRIYPVVWTSVLFLMIPLVLFDYFYLYEEAKDLVESTYLNNPFLIISIIFFPPNQYWFLQTLIFFYFIGFFFIKNFSIKKIIISITFLIVLYCITYLNFSDYSRLVIEQTLAFKLIFYAIVFLLGIYFASINKDIKYTGIKDYIILIVIILSIYTHKYLWIKGILLEYQFIQQLLILPMLYYFLKVSHSPFILNKIMQIPYISSFINLIASMTLEIYIVHILIRLYVLEYVPNFPENVFVFLIMVFVISFGFYKINNNLINRINVIKY